MPRPVQHRIDNADEWFWSRAVRDGDCLIWTGHKTWGGYGLISLEGRMWIASRLAYRLVNGSIPDGHDVCHMCPGGDRQDCIEPSHLYADTHSGNMKDSHAKRRARGLYWYGANSARYSPPRPEPRTLKEEPVLYITSHSTAA